MKKFRHLILLLLAAVVVFGCSKYDDTELKNDVSDLQSRVEKLEKWCTTANSQISALQVLTEALQAKDFVTSVTPIVDGAKEVGYTITFTNSNPITIMHGKDGASGVNGKDGITPIIGVKKDVDGLYYWTIKLGDGEVKWLEDAGGNKIRTTGDKGENGADGEDGTNGEDGHTPVISIDTFEGKLYWKVDGKWLMNGTEKVPATGATGDKGETGAQGDAVFKKDGVTSYPDKGYVEFEMADGSKFQLPLYATSISFDAYTPLQINATGSATEVAVKLPATMLKGNFAAIKAEITNEAGTSTAITRAATEKWSVTITPPAFGTDNKISTQPKVSVTVPASATQGETALLKVTVVDSKGYENSSTRVLFYDNRVAVASISITPTTLTVNTGKTSAAIAVTVSPVNATNKKVEWTSSDVTIATVAADGKVTGVKAGTATITATSEDGGKTATCAVKVEDIAVTGIALTDATLAIGDKKTLTATIAPTDATVKTVTWSSSNTAIATVNSTTGEVTAVAKGETTITATSTSNTTVKGTCKVKVEEKPSITWATGNLVADGANGAKIGTATDKGLYFQFGSLVGWNTEDPLAIAVSPVGYTGSTTWNSSWTGDPATENVATGTGDPCKYYLKGTWRLPTKDEYVELFKNHGYPSTGPWKWENSSATNTTAGLTFPASGYRDSGDGSLNRVGTYGYYWSALPVSASTGNNLYFYSSFVIPSSGSSRENGLPVRCVK